MSALSPKGRMATYFPPPLTQLGANRTSVT